VHVRRSEHAEELAATLTTQTFPEATGLAPGILGDVPEGFVDVLPPEPRVLEHVRNETNAFREERDGGYGVEAFDDVVDSTPLF
jgi:hypothetical protein